MRLITKRLSLAATLAVACVLAVPAASAADAYPSKPVRIVVPYAPGGGADLLARAIGQMLGTMWKQPVIVENRPGAGGSLGTENVARSQPDGYSLLMASPGHTINPALYHNLSFDAVKDFRAIGMVASGPLVLVVNPANPANTMKEFIDQARAKPGAVNYASAGIGSSPHLAGELLKMMAGIDLVHVPYKGTSPALTDLLGGQVQAMFAPVPTVIEYVKAGKLKALAVTSPTPFPAMPTVPPVAATVPHYEVLQWWGLVTPAGTPPAVIEKINHDVATVLRDPTMRQRLDVMGAEPGGQAPAQLDTLIADEIVKWNDVVKTANIQAQ